MSSYRGKHLTGPDYSTAPSNLAIGAGCGEIATGPHTSQSTLDSAILNCHIGTKCNWVSRLRRNRHACGACLYSRRNMRMWHSQTRENVQLSRKAGRCFGSCFDRYPRKKTVSTRSDKRAGPNQMVVAFAEFFRWLSLFGLSRRMIRYHTTDFHFIASQQMIKSRRIVAGVLFVGSCLITAGMADDRPCGPDSIQGPLRNLIPQGAFGADFRPACRQHDACYRFCIKPRKQCDRDFLAGMLCACNNSYRPRRCRRKARMMYRMTRLFGRRSYGTP